MTSRRRWIIAAAAATGLWIGVGLDTLRMLPRIALGDFETYRAGALRVLSHDPLYAPFQLAGPYGLGDAAFGQGYVYPPSAAVLSTPLALLPLVPSWLVFSLLSGGSLGLVIYQISRREGASPATSAAATAVVLASGPAVWSIATGNVNTLVAAGLGLVWLAPRTAGYLAAFGALIKLYPGMAIAWTLRSHRGPAGLSALVGPAIVGAIGLASSAAVGLGAWRDFATALGNGRSASVFVPSPRSVLSPIVGDLGAAVITIGLAAALLIVVIRIRDDRRAFALLSLALILPAPDWFAHYALIPMVGVLPLVMRAVVARAPRAAVMQRYPAAATAR